jgi:phospholipid/cholesterol/gamma-HCH transport system substrate-binding protein
MTATAPPPARRAGRRRRRLHPLAIASIAILAIVFVTYYAFNQGLPFVHRFTLHALVTNSVNVRTGSPVRIAGIDVGSVEGVSPAGRLSRITFTLNGNGLPVRTDATLRIRARLFLEGGYYLDLNPGSPGAPTAHDGYTIPPAQTAAPVQFYNVLSTFNSAARSDLSNIFDTLNQGFSPAPGQPLSDSGAGALKQAVPQFAPTLKDIAWVTQALQGTAPRDVQTLLSSSSDVTATLAVNATQLADLLTGLDRTSAALASSDGALAQTISGLDQTLIAAPPALSAIDSSLGPLERLARALDPSLKVAPPIVEQLSRSVQQLGAIVTPAGRSRLLGTLNATFVELPTVVTQLASALPITKQVTDCIQTHVVPILTREVPDGSLSTGRPVWQDFAHFLPGVAGASGNFDANGPYTRVLVAAGPSFLSGGALGTSSALGTLVSTLPPGGTSLLGARPVWAGDLTSADFRPDVPCATQPVPSLASTTGAVDPASMRARPAHAVTATEARRALAVAAGGPGR